MDDNGWWFFYAICQGSTWSVWSIQLWITAQGTKQLHARAALALKLLAKATSSSYWWNHGCWWILGLRHGWMEMDSLKIWGPIRSLVFSLLGKCDCKAWNEDMHLLNFWKLSNSSAASLSFRRWSCWSFTAFGDLFAAESLPEFSENKTRRGEHVLSHTPPLTPTVHHDSTLLSIILISISNVIIYIKYILML